MTACCRSSRGRPTSPRGSGSRELDMTPGATPPQPPPPPPPSAVRPVPQREVRPSSPAPAREVLHAPLQDLLRLVLEPERHRPDDRLVGRLEPRQARLGDHLVHRPGLRQRLPGGSAGRPPASPSSSRRPACGPACAPARMKVKTPAAPRPAAEQREAAGRERDVPTQKATTAGDDLDAADDAPAARRPCPAPRRTSRGATSSRLEALVEAATDFAELEQRRSLSSSPDAAVPPRTASPARSRA